MTFHFKRKNISAISPLALLTLTACGGGGGTGVASNPTVNGNIVKGPLSNALVFLDYNANGIMDGAETPVRTDANGGFSISATGSNYTIVALTDETTIDTSSGSVLSGITLKAPSTATVVTPTTTLMEEGDLTVEQVAAVLNLPEGVDPLTFNPFAAGVNADDALAVEKVSQQIMTAVNSFASAAEGAGADGSEAFTAALGSVIEVVKTKAEKLDDATATDAEKTLDFSNAADLDLIKAKVATKSAELAGIDTDAITALIDDTTTSIKNVNDQIGNVSDLTSDATKAAFSTMQALMEEVKEAATAEKASAGSGSISFKDPNVAETSAKNNAPTDITLSATEISETASSLVIGSLSTTDSDQAEGAAFTYSIVEADGTDYDAFTINQQTGELSLKEQPDYEEQTSYNVVIKSEDGGGKSFQKTFEIGVKDVATSLEISLSKSAIPHLEAGLNVEGDVQNLANKISGFYTGINGANNVLNDLEYAEPIDQTITVSNDGISATLENSTGDKYLLSLDFANFSPTDINVLAEMTNAQTINDINISGGFERLHIADDEGNTLLQLSHSADGIHWENPNASTGDVDKFNIKGTFANQISDYIDFIKNVDAVSNDQQNLGSFNSLYAELNNLIKIDGFSAESDGETILDLSAKDENSISLKVVGQSGTHVFDFSLNADGLVDGLLDVAGGDNELFDMIVEGFVTAPVNQYLDDINSFDSLKFGLNYQFEGDAIVSINLDNLPSLDGFEGDPLVLDALRVSDLSSGDLIQTTLTNPTEELEIHLMGFSEDEVIAAIDVAAYSYNDFGLVLEELFLA